MDKAPTVEKRKLLITQQGVRKHLAGELHSTKQLGWERFGKTVMYAGQPHSAVSWKSVIHVFHT